MPRSEYENAQPLCTESSYKHSKIKRYYKPDTVNAYALWLLGRGVPFEIRVHGDVLLIQSELNAIYLKELSG